MGIGVVDATSGQPIGVLGNYAAPSGGPNFAWTPDGQKVMFTTTVPVTQTPCVGCLDASARSRTARRQTART